MLGWEQQGDRTLQWGFVQGEGGSSPFGGARSVHRLAEPCAWRAGLFCV